MTKVAILPVITRLCYNYLAIIALFQAQYAFDVIFLLFYLCFLHLALLSYPWYFHALFLNIYKFFIFCLSFSIWIIDDFLTKETIFYFSESIDFDNFDCHVLYFFVPRVTDFLNILWWWHLSLFNSLYPHHYCCAWVSHLLHCMCIETLVSLSYEWEYANVLRMFAVRKLLSHFKVKCFNKTNQSWFY